MDRSQDLIGPNALYKLSGCVQKVCYKPYSDHTAVTVPLVQYACIIAIIQTPAALWGCPAC